MKRGWQKDYFQGKYTEGSTFEGHQTRLLVKVFPDVASESRASIPGVWPAQTGRTPSECRTNVSASSRVVTMSSS